jgi:hypothetical protein
MSELDLNKTLGQVDTDKAICEKMTSLGYDADNPKTVAKFKELEERQAAGNINARDAHREMDTFTYEQGRKAEREARAASNEQLRNPERSSADYDKAICEKMTSLGYDADNPKTVAKFKELEERQAAGNINARDAHREMDTFTYEQGRKADPATRENLRQQLNQKLDPDRQSDPADRALKREELNRHINGAARETTGTEIGHPSRSIWPNGKNDRAPDKNRGPEL